MLQAGVDSRLRHLAAETLGADLAARGLTAFVQEGQHTVGQFQHLRQLCIVSGADEHEAHGRRGVPNPRHRGVDVRDIDAGLQIGQGHQHGQPEQHRRATLQQRPNRTIVDAIVQFAPVELGVAPLRLGRQLHPKVIALVMPVGADEGQNPQRSARQMLDHRLRRFLRKRQHP